MRDYDMGPNKEPWQQDESASKTRSKWGASTSGAIKDQNMELSEEPIQVDQLECKTLSQMKSLYKWMNKRPKNRDKWRTLRHLANERLKYVEIHNALGYRTFNYIMQKWSY